MKRYYSFDDLHEAMGGTTYLEAENGETLRLVVVNGERTVSASNVVWPYGRPDLPEHEIDYDAIEEVKPISQAEFDQVWNRHLASQSDCWRAVKQAFPLGATLEGHILSFNPQGVLVDLGKDALGLADYAECAASTEPQFFNWAHKVTGTVSGYDELNQWVIFKDPRVWEERLPPVYFAGNSE